MTREERLLSAVETSAERVQAATAGRDEQVTYEALGECLTWVCALDGFLSRVPNSGYKAKREVDPRGRVLLGLRYCRNQILHGQTVVDVATVDDAPTARVIVAGRG